MHRVDLLGYKDGTTGIRKIPIEVSILEDPRRSDNSCSIFYSVDETKIPKSTPRNYINHSHSNRCSSTSKMAEKIPSNAEDLKKLSNEELVSLIIGYATENDKLNQYKQTQVERDKNALREMKDEFIKALKNVPDAPKEYTDMIVPATEKVMNEKFDTMDTKAIEDMKILASAIMAHGSLWAERAHKAEKELEAHKQRYEMSERQVFKKPRYTETAASDFLAEFSKKLTASQGGGGEVQSYSKPIPLGTRI